MPPFWPIARIEPCDAPGCSAFSITTAMARIPAESNPGCGWRGRGERLGGRGGRWGRCLPGVRFAVDAYVNFARRAPWPEAVCSSLTELFAPEIHKQRLANWPQHYPWKNRPGLQYFQSRVSLARRDVEFSLAVTLERFDTRALQERALEILKFKLDVLWQMSDAMALRYMVPA